jgi:hypothetical protein
MAMNKKPMTAAALRSVLTESGATDAAVEVAQKTGAGALLDEAARG